MKYRTREKVLPPQHTNFFIVTLLFMNNYFLYFIFVDGGPE